MLLIWIVGECTFVTDVLYYPIEAFISINHTPIYSNEWIRLGSKRQEQDWEDGLGVYIARLYIKWEIPGWEIALYGQMELRTKDTEIGHQLLNIKLFQTASCFLTFVSNKSALLHVNIIRKWCHLAEPEPSLIRTFCWIQNGRRFHNFALSLLSVTFLWRDVPLNDSKLFTFVFHSFIKSNNVF